ncbi:MAG TPA: YtxH domain-containing protein [Smithella sp.]|jgi:gas vesicle protein|nr:YtxH domain-containing protein [Smithella sp.]OQC53685.1 MAG: YtxH-like protein [Deltaproteobacteria bacterium ADurb.Bin022]HNQ66351.1 YtxH domain-containing protein [Smithella sp.]HOE33494.1 YtxH domain-containing protein [Smithella sp.]HOG11066.1 YtxH domain-containing protein [Smithella sp.]
MTEKNGDVLKGLFIGGLIGIALGILFAPKSGKETRDDILLKTDEMLARVKEEYEKALEKSRLAYEDSLNRLKGVNLSVKAKAGEAEGKISELAQQGSEAMLSNKNKLKKAIDAGLKAYKEELGKEKI